MLKIPGTKKSIHPYIQIQLILAGIILLIAVYSGIFSDQKAKHPVSCTHEKLFGKPCPSCGMSRSFSAMMRFDIDAARHYNPFGPRIFLFFFVQFWLRLLFPILLFKNAIGEYFLIIIDATVSIALFIYCFYPLILRLFSV